MFVGPNEPAFILPANVKFIKATVKPAQCYFIAGKSVPGDYLFNVSDDVVYTPGTLDYLLQMASHKDIITPRYSDTVWIFMRTIALMLSFLLGT